MGLELTLRRTQLSSINAAIRDKTFIQVRKDRGFSSFRYTLYLTNWGGVGYLAGQTRWALIRGGGSYERGFLFHEMGYERKVVWSSVIAPKNIMSVLNCSLLIIFLGQEAAPDPYGKSWEGKSKFLTTFIVV